MRTTLKFLLAFSIILAVSCDSGKKEKASGEEASEKKVEINMDGPDVEVNVLSFDIEKRQTELELINRLNKPIRNIRGWIYFKNAEGEVLTYANGTEKTSNFQKMQNPHIVEALSKTTWTLGNKLEEQAVEVIAVVIEVETTDGEKIVFGQE